MDPVVTPTAVAALGELIATAVTVSAVGTWKSIRGKPEARTIKAAIDAAVTSALRNAALPVGAEVDDAWVAQVATMWRSAFTTQVSEELVACISDPSRDQAHFALLARHALEADGCDLAELGRAFWVEEFLSILPRRLFECLSAASSRDDNVRGLVDHLLRQRADARVRKVEIATPGEFRQDLTILLHRLDEQACTGRLPPYLPPHADVTALSRTVRVRRGIRYGAADGGGRGDPGEYEAGRGYRLPAERIDDADPPRAWPEVAAEHRRLLVLADPGLGKSWLIRTETHRLACEALACLDGDPVSLIVPIPVRCDQLVSAPGPDLAEKAAAYLVAQRLLPERSRAGLAAKILGGEVALLLDAFDELTRAQTGLLNELVRSWADHAGGRAHCLITSRIAGYTGSPLPGAFEVELQAFTSDDMTAVISAWRLPPPAVRRLLDRAEDPAIGAMARIPLLLALLCALTAELPADEALPRTRAQLYDRVLRWFLTRAHRSLDDSTAPTLDDIEVDALLEIVVPLAFTFATQLNGWIDLMPTDRLLTAIRAIGPAFTERRRPAAEVLRELSVTAGVLVPDGDPSAGRSPSYLFLHRTVAEYLVARHLATLPEEDWLAIVDQHRWFDPDWAEVIPMLGEHLSPPAICHLIQHLLADETDPFHHSLFTAIRVWGTRADADHLLPASLEAVLARATEHLIRQERGRTSIGSQLSAVAYLPQSLLTRLLGLLGDDDRMVRRAAVEALADREDPGVTEALLVRLGDDHWGVRSEAVQRLAAREDPAVTEALLAHLESKERGVRYAAAEALAGRRGTGVTEKLLVLLGSDDLGMRYSVVQGVAAREGPGVTEALLARLGDDEMGVRYKAVHALADRNDPAVIEALLARLSDDDPGVRSAAVQALAGPRQAFGVTERLLARLRKDDRGVRHVAVKAGTERQKLAVTEALLARLDDDDEEVRDMAVQALTEREGPGVIEAFLALLADDEPHARLNAAEALAAREGPGVTEALLARLDDDDESVRHMAVCALEWREGPGVTEALLGRVDDERRVRYAAVQALAVREGPGVTEALLARLGDDDGDVRGIAVKALAAQEGPGVTEALLARLGDQDAGMRCAAVRALAGREGPGVTEALLARLGDDDGYLRVVAVRALAGREGPGVTEALLARLGDDNGYLREVAVQALAGRKCPAVTEALLARLSDHDADIRYAAVQALAGQEDPGVIEALLARLDDNDKDVRRLVVRALESPQHLLTLAKAIQRLPRFSLLQVFDTAEQLMIRHYVRIEAAEQPAVRAAMGWLTAALTENTL